MKYYKYRSIRTINNAYEKYVPYFDESNMIVDKTDEELDEQEQREMKFPVLLDFCLALSDVEFISKDVSKGLFCLTTSKLVSMYAYFSNAFIEPYKEQLVSLEKQSAKTVLEAIDNAASFAYYVLTEISLYYDHMLSEDSKVIHEAKRKHEELKNNYRYSFPSSNFERLLINWRMSI